MNNPKIKIKQTDLLSNNWYLLNNVTFDFLRKDGVWVTQKREVYDRGNGAGILLYNREQKTIILTRQFRLPAYLNGNETGMMVEVCAGLLDQDHPEQCIIRETEEEIGVPAKQLIFVRSFTELYIPPSNFMVYPFLAYSLEDLSFFPDPTEVAQIVEISLQEFLENCPIALQTRATSYNPEIEVPCFIIQGHEVWGATAMILSELKETFKILVQ